MDATMIQTAVPLLTQFALSEAFGEARFPAPEQPIVVRTA
jgi:hypothetical protein